jgi:hypothetical protein
MANYISGLILALKRSLGRFAGAKSNEDSASGVSKENKPTGPKAGLAHVSEPRRYKRAVLIVGAQAGLHSQLASATATYRGKTFSVVDLSHTGIAMLREDIADHELPDVTKSEPLSLVLGLQPSFTAQVNLVRHSERIMAFEFTNVPTEGRMAIDRFLDPKMIGLNMRPIDKAFFSSGETFSTWFCGPRDTNFFLWTSGPRVERAIIQMGDETFALFPSSVSGVRFVRQNGDAGTTESDASGLRKSVHFALDVALQVHDRGDAIKGLIKLLTEAADSLPAGS